MHPETSSQTNINHWFPDVAQTLIDYDQVVPLYELAHTHSAAHKLSLTQMRCLYAGLKAQGFLSRALHVAEMLVERTDGKRKTVDLLLAEKAVLSGAADTSQPLADAFAPRQSVVLLITGSSLPDVDSSYTRRTHDLAKSGSRIGVKISVCTQMGSVACQGYAVDDVAGIEFHRIPGPARGTEAFDKWIDLYARRIAAVVRKVRPSALIASSDFVNGVAAQSVSRAFQIPFIYDVRGFWENSWLRRQREKYAWSEDQVPRRWGMPETWTFRRARESDLVASADAVITLTPTLKEESKQLGAAPERVHVIEDVETDIDVLAEALERVGVLEPGLAELTSVTFTGTEMINLLTEGDRKPLGNVETFANRGTVRKILEEGWRHGKLEPIKITAPFDWINACRDHRSQGFHLHAWDFMVPFLAAWERTRERDLLVWCLDRAVDWANTFNDGSERGTMAWYDMAIGLRAPRLAYLVQEAVREDVDCDIDVLARAVIAHQRAIFAANAFNAATNHGFYTAVGQLSFARRLQLLPGMRVIDKQGEERLSQVVSTQFANDGGHLEHSPDYHRMLVSSFLGAMDDGLLTDEVVAERTRRAEEVMGWFIRPDRRTVQIGDSPSRLARRSDRAMSAPHTQFLVTGGESGKPNKQELLVLQDSGYAIVRSPQPEGRDDHEAVGYLTFMGGFHSRAHKHCDDLSLTWFDAGHELLIDSGRFGYLDQLPANSPQREEGFFYGRPERQYVERTIAHNTVQADCREHDRRGRAPYGSAIGLAEKRDGCFRLAGEVDHGFWKHNRLITFSPGAWLMVTDEVTSLDGAPHDFTVWWNLPESLGKPKVHADRVSFLLPDGRSFHVINRCGSELVEPVKGQSEPLRGWRSEADYEFTPAWSMGFRQFERVQHSFSTLFCFDEALDTD